MTKTIDTLIEDIHDVLLNGVEELSDKDVEEFSNSVAQIVSRRLLAKREQRRTLRMSNVGSPCERKLWYEINLEEGLEELTPDAILKFLYGDLIEALLIFLTKVSGHKVEGEQSEMDLHGIKGHRDVVIDGHLVDVKSASSFSFKKFKEGRLKEDDPFGYIPQILSYLESSQDDPVVVEKDKAAFFVADKTLGHLCLDWHDRKSDWDWKEILEYKKGVVNGDEVPERSFEPEPFGKSGNFKLGTFCSYCSAKNVCYPELRTFLYSTGPVFMTKVTREPDVYEVKKETDEREAS